MTVRAVLARMAAVGRRSCQHRTHRRPNYPTAPSDDASRCKKSCASWRSVAARLADLEREKARLARQLARAEAIIDLQKKSGEPAGRPPDPQRQRALTDAVVALGPGPAHDHRGMRRARRVSRQRLSPPRRPDSAQAVVRPRPAPPRALRADQTQAVLDFLHEPLFIDQAPVEIYATLLDDPPQHLCSKRGLCGDMDVIPTVGERSFSMAGHRRGTGFSDARAAIDVTGGH